MKSYEVIMRAHELFNAKFSDSVYPIVFKACHSVDSAEVSTTAIFTLLINWNRVWYRISGKGRRASSNLSRHLYDLYLTIMEVKPLLDQLCSSDITKIDFDDNVVRMLVKSCFERVYDVCGATGASKVLHLLCPRLFVMWDDAIRNAFGVSPDSEGYLEFLSRVKDVLMKIVNEYARDNNISRDQAVRELEGKLGVTLCKAIDEYNWLKFSRKFDIPSIFEETITFGEGEVDEKIRKIIEIIDELVNDAYEVANQDWAIKTGVSGMIKASADKLKRIIMGYAERGDLDGIRRYIEAALNDDTGKKVSRYLQAARKRTLEKIYPKIIRIIEGP